MNTPKTDAIRAKYPLEGTAALDLAAKLEERAAKLEAALTYWLPTECPLPNATDPIVLSHHIRWHEAKALLMNPL